MRYVRTVRLSAPSHQLVHRGSILVEDAVRTASLPEAEGGRLYVVRSLDIGTIGSRNSSSSVALAVERSFARAQESAVHGSDARARASSVVYFHDAVEAHTLLAVRLASGGDMHGEWFWPLAVLSFAFQQPRDEAMRGVLFSALSLPQGAVAGVLLVQAVLQAGGVDTLLGALRWQDGPTLIRASGLISGHGSAALERPHTLDQLRVVERWARTWGRADSRSVWLAGVVLAAHAPVRMLDGQHMARAERLLAEIARAGGTQGGDTHVDGSPPSHRETPNRGGDTPHRHGDTPLDGGDTSPSSGNTRLSRGATRPSRGDTPPSRGATRPSRGDTRPFRGDTPRSRGDTPLLGGDTPPSGGNTPLSHADTPPYGGDTPFDGEDTPPVGGDTPPSRGDTSRSRGDTPPLDGDNPRSGGNTPLSRGDIPDSGGDTPVSPGDMPLFDASIHEERRWVSFDPLPTEYAGLYFVLTLLQRLHIASASAPSDLATRALRRLASRLRIPADDPVLQPLEDIEMLNVDAEASRWLSDARKLCRRSTRMGLSALVHRHGLIEFTRTHIDVTFPLSGVDIRLRRAGLDVDPGWLPWFGRVVLFHYDG